MDIARVFYVSISLKSNVSSSPLEKVVFVSFICNIILLVTNGGAPTQLGAIRKLHRMYFIIFGPPILGTADGYKWNILLFYAYFFLIKTKIPKITLFQFKLFFIK